MASTPWWQRQLNGALKTVNPRLEAAVHRDEFAVAVGLARNIGGAARRRFERSSRRALHLFNLPAGSDVTLLFGQIASLERQLRELTKAIEERDGKVTRRAGARSPQ